MIQFLRRKSRVLLLDDDVSMQKLVATLLKREGLRVLVVDHGMRAIEELERGSFDAILLDLMMPHEGGMTVIRHLREKDPEVLQRVLILTATPGAVLKGIAREVAGVVQKPFAPETLVAEVRRVIAA